MSKKPKRIRAKKAYCGEGEGIVISSPCVGWTEPCYIHVTLTVLATGSLRQSDVRTLAEQMVRDIDEVFNRFEGREAAVLEALKRAGITPGKEAQ